MQIHQLINKIFVHAAMGFKQGVFGLLHQGFFVLEVGEGAVNQVKQYDRHAVFVFGVRRFIEVVDMMQHLFMLLINIGDACV